MKKILAFALTAVFILIPVFSISAANGNTVNETVDALYLSKAPTFDGKITAAEWGEPIKVDKNYKTGFLYENGSGDLTMDLYLRWDETYFYVGVTSPDTDGQSTQKGETNTWNGDSVQFRIDPKGANSSGDKNAPFVDNATLPNMCFSYLTNEKKLSLWDNRNTTLDGIAKLGYSLENNLLTVEIAVPHEYVGGKGEAGFTYGCTVVRLNAPTGGTYNGWLTWGDGVCGPQDNDERCGSNAVVLSKTEAVVIETKPSTSTGGASSATAAQTFDAGYVMFAVIAVLSAAGAFWVRKKSR